MGGGVGPLGGVGGGFAFPLGGGRGGGISDPSGAAYWCGSGSRGGGRLSLCLLGRGGNAGGAPPLLPP